MATNVIFYPGEHLSLPVIADTVSGDPVVLGSNLPGIALTDRDSDGNASVLLAGVGEFTITFTAARAIGDLIYITTATYALSDAAGAGKVVYGVLLTTVAGATEEVVRISIGPGIGA